MDNLNYQRVSPLPDLWVAAARRMYFAGQGGSGKTEWVVKATAGHRIVVLSPENDLAGSHQKTPQIGLEPWQAQTIHRYLCIDPTKWMEDWDPTALGHRLDNLAEAIVIDECCKVSTKTLKVIFDYLARRTCQVICCGESGQIPPWGNKEGPHQMLKEWARLDVEKGLLLEWRYAGWGTEHRVQGKIVRHPGRLYVVDHSLSGWVSNAVYTAIMSIRLMGQVCASPTSR